MAYDTPLTGLDWLEYYSKHDVYHPGVDLNRGYGNQDLGDPVYALTDGIVEYVAPYAHNGGFGHFIVLHHPAHNRWTRYAHLDKYTVKRGDMVVAGQQIATNGNSGTTYAHVHLEGWLPNAYAVQKENNYRFYPTGWSKDKVQEYYFNPLEWIEELNNVPGWQLELEEWAAAYLHEVPGFLRMVGPGAHRILALMKRVHNNETITNA